MTRTPLTYTAEELADARHRLRDAIAQQALEDNPLTDEEIIVLDRGERQGWSIEQWHEAFTLLPEGMTITTTPR